MKFNYLYNQLSGVTTVVHQYFQIIIMFFVEKKPKQY